MAAVLRDGLCNDPGPGDAHCTGIRWHRWSCYDAQADVSWNDGQWAAGWFEGQEHRCGDPRCAGRETGE